MYFWNDWTMLLLIPALIFSFWTQARMKRTFDKFAQVEASRSVTSEKVALFILKTYGINDVEVERVPGALTDHYDPVKKALRLSDEVYGSSSIAAIGVAAHETGHAIQHARGFAPISIRNAIVPVANIASNLAIPIFFIGLLFSMPVLLRIGIYFFTGVVAFHLVTLPVEFDASSRALKVLKTGSFLNSEELEGARAVLGAAAMTYVAAALMSLVQLIRMLILSRGRD